MTKHADEDDNRRKQEFRRNDKKLFNPVLIYPDPWAMPMPSVATMTMLKGGKDAKLLTILVINVTNDCGASMLVTLISSPVVGWIYPK